ncbi:hypothetical protein EWF20_06100 [Sulfolobus sp. S-194]|uniref:hypothetical protein n=1 Tax=Sulfolobus sp. S-194 TaxID=2512240 RepID=UPI001436FE33|nr:hypothetical protein [Sulfolobus sp. S-194]QIW23770.1 hypothetical protein EWF20_06100 [Sulfolobus sp. S-194]
MRIRFRKINYTTTYILSTIESFLFSLFLATLLLILIIREINLIMIFVISLLLTIGSYIDILIYDKVYFNLSGFFFPLSLTISLLIIIGKELLQIYYDLFLVLFSSLLFFIENRLHFKNDIGYSIKYSMLISMFSGLVSFLLFSRFPYYFAFISTFIPTLLLDFQLSIRCNREIIIGGLGVRDLLVLMPIVAMLMAFSLNIMLPK